MGGKRILIVEDDGIIALAIAELLEKEGYQVSDMFYSGEQVLLTLEHSNMPDLILLDIGLSGSINGIEVARQIRRKISIPIIFVTAYTSDKILNEMNEVAPDGVIHKPFVNISLLNLIHKAIGKNVAST